MKTSLTALAIAALLVAGSPLPGFAEDIATPQTPAAQAPTATPPYSRPKHRPHRAASVNRAENR